jgi:hypothetical protein
VVRQHCPLTNSSWLGFGHPLSVSGKGNPAKFPRCNDRKTGWSLGWIDAETVMGVLCEQAGHGLEVCFAPGVPGEQAWNSSEEDVMLKRGFQVLLVACLAMGTLWAASEPLAGKWKLDLSRSQRTDLMRVAAAGANKYTLIFNNGDVETIVADGTDQPGMFGTTVSIAIAGPHNWTVVRKKNGKTLLTGNWNLADDGKTLTDHFSSIQANGTTSSVNYVYARTAGDSGFLGSWEAKSDDNSAFELQIQPWEGDGISFVDASEGLTRNMKFDGKDYPIAGGYPESAASGRRVNERSVEVTDRIKGRIADTQEIEVSPDGKTLTITERPSGQSKPNILVFDRE